MIERDAKVPVKRQAQLLDLSRSSVYYRPRPVLGAGSEADAAARRAASEAGRSTELAS